MLFRLLVRRELTIGGSIREGAAQRVTLDWLKLTDKRWLAVAYKSDAALA
jgi:hypothetical protein